MRRASPLALALLTLALLALPLLPRPATALPACAAPCPDAPPFPGRAIAAGDFDGDGLEDLAVLTLAGFEFGYELWRGTPAGLGATTDTSIGSTASTEAALAFAVADLDADGADDLVIVERDLPGAARVLFGGPGWPATATFDDLLARTLVISGGPGINPGGLTAAASTAVGDLNGDGRLDLVVGYPFDNSMFTLEPDRFHVFLGPLGPGSRSLASAEARIELPMTAAYRGHKSAAGLAIGDVDRDGLSDLVLGTFEVGGLAGGLVVVRGRPGFSGVFEIPATAPDIDVRLPSRERFGTWAQFEDVDQDGIADLLASASLEGTLVAITGAAPAGITDLDAPGGPERLVLQAPTGTSLLSGLVAGPKLLLAAESDLGYSVPLTMLPPSGELDLASLPPDACELSERPNVAGDFDGDGNDEVAANSRSGWRILGAAGGSDTEPPSLSIDSAPNELWAPLHRYVSLRLGTDVLVRTTDDCATDVTVRFAGATSSEPDDGSGDGRTLADVLLLSDTEIALRAERSGRGPGRTYVVTVVALDDAGNEAEASFEVIVRHDRRDGPPARGSRRPPRR